MQDLRVAAIQTELHWHDAADNRSMFDEYLDEIGTETDVVVLPEMFSTGFTQAPEQCAEPMSGPTVEWMRSQAARIDAAITGSLVIESDGQYFNRLIWMQPDGAYSVYDKRHLFRMAGEHHHYVAGAAKLVVEFRGWRICPMICYDLRFPVWIRNTQQYDLLIFVANWPSLRREAWRTLLRARAIENIAYTIGVNRVGTDGNDIPYAGDSAIVDYTGQTISENAGENTVLRASFERGPLDKFRNRFPFYEDADRFRILE